MPYDIEAHELEYRIISLEKALADHKHCLFIIHSNNQELKTDSEKISIRVNKFIKVNINEVIIKLINVVDSDFEFNFFSIFSSFNSLIDIILIINIVY